MDIENLPKIDLQELNRIEDELEQKWLAEFRDFAESSEARVDRANMEMVRWRSICLEALRKSGLPIIYMAEELTQDDHEAILEKIELYMKMGLDFESLITAIKSNDTCYSAWEKLMVAMRLSGLDEIQDRE